ncbi:MAG: hypothetical protein II088_02160 [Bacteroidales bacterium]|nr:hypothetical protein [Bacteroidales bacterium]
MTTEELLKQALNEQLCRTQVANVTSRHAYDLYDLELTNNNITTTELAAISEVTGDDDLQIESRGNWLYVVATIDDDMIEEIREQYE